MVVDLHCHSNFSDGSLSPADVVERAHAHGVTLLAITDHDEVAGLAEAKSRADELGITLINGVEISVSWENNFTLHIVGLNIDCENTTLRAGLEDIRQRRISRAEKIARRLESCGVPDAWKTVTEQAGYESVTRTHFARFLVERGHAKDSEQAFKRWLGRKGKAYVNGTWVSMPDAVRWINQAGGDAVLAHPVRYNLSRTKLDTLVSEFKACGGRAIEVVSNRYTPNEKSAMIALAKRHELFASVGSDFHVPGNPYIELGRNLGLPENVAAIWQTWELN